MKLRRIKVSLSLIIKKKKVSNIQTFSRNTLGLMRHQKYQS